MAVYGVYRLTTSGGARQYQGEQVMAADSQTEVLDKAAAAFAVETWNRVTGVLNCKLVNPSNAEDVVHCELLNVTPEV